MTRMTPKEFHTYWYTDEQASLVASEYLSAESEAERMKVLSKWGLTEYKKEINRKIWLDKLLWTYIEDELGKDPSSRVLLEQEHLIKKFKGYLQDLELLREYEIEDLVETYRGELICQSLFRKCNVGAIPNNCG